ATILLVGFILVLIAFRFRFWRSGFCIRGRMRVGGRRHAIFLTLRFRFWFRFRRRSGRRGRGLFRTRSRFRCVGTRRLFHMTIGTRLILARRGQWLLVLTRRRQTLGVGLFVLAWFHIATIFRFGFRRRVRVIARGRFNTIIAVVTTWLHARRGLLGLRRGTRRGIVVARSYWLRIRLRVRLRTRLWVRLN